MDQALSADLANRLKADFGFVERPNWLNYGRCPRCGKKELFTHKAAPWVIRCGRESKCDYEANTRDLYPDAFKPVTERHPATKQDPNATARAYMAERGLNTSLVTGQFSQQHYYHPEKKLGAITCRFTLRDAKGPVNQYWERLLENEKALDRKACFGGDHGQLWWQPKNMQINDGDVVYLVEGIFDAIALWQSKQKAIALLTCGKYPADLFDSYKHLKVVWVWALDNDKAGRRYLAKHIDRCKASNICAKAALVPQQDPNKKIDWNDLLQGGHLAADTVTDTLEHAHYLGNLVIAESAVEKALIMYKRKGSTAFSFEFKQQLYWFKMDLDQYDKAYQMVAEREESWTEEQLREAALKECGNVQVIAQCHPEFLYYQANKMTDEAWYYVRVNFPHKGKAVTGTFTSRQIVSNSDFASRLTHVAPGALWQGTANQLQSLVRDRIYNIKTVDTIDFIGYSREHEAYIWPEYAVQHGQLFKLNDEDYFELPSGSVKTLAKSPELALAASYAAEQNPYEWVRQVWNAWGAKGLVVVAWWIATFFAEQIRHEHKSWSFLEVVGDPGAGKSTLIEFLWRLAGREDYEGFDPSNSTAAGRARNFVQVSNLPVVLLEGDRGEADAKQRGFDFNELKLLYNGRGVRARGHKNAANDTYEPPFRGGILITQNAEVTAEDAVLQRIVHVHFTCAGQSERTRAASEAIAKISTEQVSHFLVDACLRERELMQGFNNNAKKFENYLLSLPDIKNVRVAKNHGQLMAAMEMLNTLVTLPNQQLDDTQAELQRMAVDRQKAIGADHPIVQDFWETYEYLVRGTGDKAHLNHSRTPENLICINMPEFINRANNEYQKLPELQQLKRLLKTSRNRKFVGIKTVKSKHSQKAYLKCWVFETATKEKTHD